MNYFFTPYDSRGLGHAYNACARLVTRPDDWVGFHDADCMLFPANWGDQIQFAQTQHPEYDVLSCYATRIWKGSQQQFPNAPLREEQNLCTLKRASCQAAKLYWGKVAPLTKGDSGHFFMFRRRVFSKCEFPLLGVTGERNLGIDTGWFRAVRAAGFQIGLMLGLLGVHYYRLGEGDTFKDHLR